MICLQHAPVEMYTDDTVIYIHEKKCEEAEKLTQIIDVRRHQKVTQQHSVHVSGEMLQVISSLKYLGVILGSTASKTKLSKLLQKQNSTQTILDLSKKMPNT